MSREFLKSETFPEQDKQKWEKLLWEKAAELKVVRESLYGLERELYEQVNTGREMNLHEQEIAHQKEAEYWRVKEKLDLIKEQEKEIEDLLLKLDEGIADSSRLEAIAGRQGSDQNVLSKRKQRMLEERERQKRSSIDPREMVYDAYSMFGGNGFGEWSQLGGASGQWVEFGPDANKLTTGRNLKRVKNLGEMTPSEAAEQFFYRTADTHGGKVAHGKRGSAYVSRSGKHIRKY